MLSLDLLMIVVSEMERTCVYLFIFIENRADFILRNRERLTWIIPTMQTLAPKLFEIQKVNKNKSREDTRYICIEARGGSRKENRFSFISADLNDVEWVKKFIFVLLHQRQLGLQMRVDEMHIKHNRFNQSDLLRAC